MDAGRLFFNDDAPLAPDILLVVSAVFLGRSFVGLGFWTCVTFLGGAVTGFMAAFVVLSVSFAYLLMNNFLFFGPTYLRLVDQGLPQIAKFIPNIVLDMLDEILEPSRRLFQMQIVQNL